jgi:hypothetical protein
MTNFGSYLLWKLLVTATKHQVSTQMSHICYAGRWALVKRLQIDLGLMIPIPAAAF